jgi:hypothetical protein
MTCPHCHVLASMEIELFFGDTRNLDIYAIGDSYKWIPRKIVQNGGRPENGNLDGEGYAGCPNCQKDFFVKVVVRNDHIKNVSPDTEKAAYISSSDPALPLQVARSVQPKWDPVAYAGTMRKSTHPVSAFFLIDSPAAFSICKQWLSCLEPYGMPGMHASQYFKDVLNIYQAGSKVINFDYEFNLLWQNKEFPGRLRCHFFDKQQYEIELWLPGALANEIADKFKDGHEGFFCAFMPPAFYD